MQRSGVVNLIRGNCNLYPKLVPSWKWPQEAEGRIVEEFYRPFPVVVVSFVSWNCGAVSSLVVSWQADRKL